MNSFKKYFFRDPSQKWFWLLLSLVIKSVPFFLLLHNKPLNDIPGFWGGAQGDTSSYLAPIESFVSNGNYQPDFRMPGYGIVFYPLLLLFSKAAACNIVIILQFIIASVSVYYLALAAKNTFNNSKIFYLVFYLFLFSYYTNFYDAYIQTEAFCTASLIFAVYFFTKYYSTALKKYLIYASLLVCWIIFLRPVYLPIILLFAGLIAISKNLTLPARLKNAVLFLIPFLVCDGAWVARNYTYHKKFIPLTVSALYPYTANSYLQPLLEFVQSWGGCAHAGENKGASINWFDYYYPGRVKPNHIDSLPDDIYTSQFNKDSLVHLKKLIQALQQPHVNSLTNAAYQNELKTKFARYRLSIAHEKPFLYYIIAPIKLIGIFIYGPETIDYLERGKVSPSIGPFVIAFNKIFYLLMVILGFTGAFVLVFKGLRGNYLYLLISLIPFYVLIVHPILLRFAVNRFLMPVYPFLIVCSGFILTTIYKKLLQVKLQPQ